MDSKYFLCSECFKDIGLKTEAKKVSIKDNSVCIHCGKKTGNKLNKKLRVCFVIIFLLLTVRINILTEVLITLTITRLITGQMIT